MLRVAVESATAASRRRGNGTLPCDEHPFQARGFFEAASARLRRALRRSHHRVSAQGGGLIPASIRICIDEDRQFWGWRGCSEDPSCVLSEDNAPEEVSR